MVHLGDLIEELPTCTEFSDNVKELFVLIKLEDLDDIGVIL